MTTRNFGMGFFGRPEDRKKFREAWSKMTDSEKLEMMNRRMEMMDNPESRFSVEALDARCEEWMKKTPEEKETFVNEWKEKVQNRKECMGAFFGGDHRAHEMNRNQQ